MDELWIKYHLALDFTPPSTLYSDNELRRYESMAACAHDAVANYYEDNPDKCDLSYYDALKIASPRLYKRVSEWSADYWKRRARWEKDLVEVKVGCLRIFAKKE